MSSNNMQAHHRATGLKILMGLLWLALFVAAYGWMHSHGISVRRLPRVLRVLVHSYGFWGPLLIIGLHVVRTFLFIPTSVLALITGSFYGPIWGSALTIIGENISSSIAFFLGRFFGRRYIREHEHGWVRKYDALLMKEGFFAILAMRLLFFPFDPVNYLGGMTGVTFRQYALATFLGLLPAAITFSVLGDAFDNPRGFLLFALLCAGTVTIVIALRRSDWVKEKLFAKTPEHVI